MSGYTGRFIMFSVITNIYNKKTKGPTLMELFTATGKQKKFFLTTRDVRCVHHRWHSTHRYDIQVLATHASACWQVFFSHLGFGHILFLCNNELVIQNVPTILYILLLHGTVDAGNLLQHLRQNFFLAYVFYKGTEY